VLGGLAVPPSLTRAPTSSPQQLSRQWTRKTNRSELGAPLWEGCVLMHLPTNRATLSCPTISTASAREDSNLYGTPVSDSLMQKAPPLSSSPLTFSLLRFVISIFFICSYCSVHEPREVLPTTAQYRSHAHSFWGYLTSYGRSCEVQNFKFNPFA
jgi:hypothetical protein